MRRILLLVLWVFIPFLVIAQTSADPSLLGLPSSFHWRNQPVDWSTNSAGLTIKAGEKTDWYIAPHNGETVASSPLLLFPSPKDFWLSAKVTLDFKSQYDAGALVLYVDEKTWVKFAFESPNGKTGGIVSVVTRELSDDNTGASVEGDSVYLEVSKTGQAIFLFFSTDGKTWNVTRAFNLGSDRPLQFGFSAQSPKGAGSTVTFSEIRYKAEALSPWTAK